MSERGEQSKMCLDMGGGNALKMGVESNGVIHKKWIRIEEKTEKGERGREGRG